MNGCATARRAAAINLPVVLSASGDSSTTRSGISGGAIKPIFDANTVSADVNAQLQITQAFSQVAPKAVANFADQQQASLEKQAKQLPENDPRKQTLLNEAKQWTEGGSCLGDSY